MSDGQKLGLKVRRKEGDVETTFYGGRMKDPGIYFKKGFSMKREKRRIGTVAAMHGFLKWAVEESTKKVEFVIVEKDVNNVSGEFTDISFARHKV